MQGSYVKPCASDDASSLTTLLTPPMAVGSHGSTNSQPLRRTAAAGTAASATWLIAKANGPALSCRKIRDLIHECMLCRSSGFRGRVSRAFYRQLPEHGDALRQRRG